MPILDNVFSKLDFTICQGTKDLKRFIELGVNKERVIADYSFKFDSLSITNERDNFGTNSLYDIGDDYDRFHKYINYIILLQKIQEDEDDEVIIAFKQDMKYVYLSILENEEEEEESEEESEQEESEEEEEEEQPDREI